MRDMFSTWPGTGERCMHSMIRLIVKAANVSDGRGRGEDEASVFRPRAASWRWLSRAPASGVCLSLPLPAPFKRRLIALSRLSPGSHRAAALGPGFNSVLITAS